MPVIPNKLYFRIGEVSKLVGVEPYVLRYWESEFQDIKPSKSKSGQRLSKRRDVEMLLKIKELLYEERYTINGARKRLKDVGKGDEKENPLPKIEDKPKSRQLEVFAGKDEGDVDEVVVTSRSAKASKEAVSNTKVLKKIKGDLQELLSIVKV